MQNTDVFGSLSPVRVGSGHAPVAAPAGENWPIAALLLACSGCTGDYEDPDVTAWTEGFDDGDEVDEDERATVAEKFPVQRN